MMRIHDTASRGVFRLLPIAALTLAAMLTGCGEGITTPPGGDSAQENESGPDSAEGSDDSAESSEIDGSADGSIDGATDEGDSGEPVEYVWGLPPSDTSVGENHQGSEGTAYAALQRSCAEGAEFITGFGPDYGFESPRNVLLFAAGVRLCEGERAAASELFAHAMTYGTAGLTPETWAFCDLLKVVWSVLEQRPPEEASCGGGEAPPFKVGDDGSLDDPLTFDVDESVPVTGTEPAPDPGTDPDEEADPGQGTDPDQETQTDPGTDTDSGTGTDPGTDTDPGTETGETGADPNSDMESGAGETPDTGTGATP